MLIIYSLLQWNVPCHVTGRMACAHTLMTLAHQIYLMIAEIYTLAQFRQTNAAAGMDSTKNVLSSRAMRLSLVFMQFLVLPI